jgi:hypothetical protein
MANKVKDDTPIRVLFASRKAGYIMHSDIMEKIHELQRERDELIADHVHKDMSQYSEFQNLITIQDGWRAVDKWVRDFTKPLSADSWYEVFERRDEEQNAPVEKDD